MRSGLDLLAEARLSGRARARRRPTSSRSCSSTEPNLLKGDLIDDRPLSETEPIRAYTASGENYIDWLDQGRQAPRTTRLRLQQGFSDGPPTALLYLMLHHALDLSFVETSIRLFFNAGLLDQAELKAAKREPDFIQVREASLADPIRQAAAAGSISTATIAAVTGTADRTVGAVHPDSPHHHDRRPPT